MGPIGLLLRTAIAPALWGTTYLVTTEFLPAGHPMWIAALRALPAGLVLLALRPGLPSGSWWLRSLLLGTLNFGAFFALLFVAAQRLPGGVAATLGATQPLLVLGLAALLLRERPHLAMVLAALVGVAGVSLLVLRGSAAFDAVGVAAGLGTAGVMALGMVLTRRWGRPTGRDGMPVHQLTSTAWQLLGGAVVLVPLALLTEGGLPAIGLRELGGFAWLSLIGTALTYAVYFAGVHRLPAALTSLLSLASPVVATLLGWLVLGQSLGGPQLLGAGLVLLSVVAGPLLRQLSVTGRFPLSRERQRVVINGTSAHARMTRMAQRTARRDQVVQ
ncbi:EamA family transporter [Kutzneria viridogrisea]|uniref:EamA domain-containing protein n=2 Tax=Kutzneria TaxID=43356 RepID=W5VXI5_9PSEU|nr:EamA family transporter [Kutzneria albida]AHH93553.1 hypothetical protein KALB_176 [Kutzneria albida DSM 43870]MBA8929062.1 putative blue pigment (indigoidine) exporter [Kutzneria viridogrisea]